MKPIMIDVREPDEFATGHVDGAINIPPATLLHGMPQQLEHIPKDTPLIVYCRSGSRAQMALPYFQKLGFTNLTNGINQASVEQHFS